MKKNKIKVNIKRVVAGCLFLGIIVAVVSRYFIEFGFKFPSERGDFGTLGDYLGGTLNPVLAFISVIALLYTIKLQSTEMELTRIELSDTKTVMREQLKTQSLQQFDSIFFPMLTELNTIFDKLENDPQASGKANLEWSYQNVFQGEINLEEAWKRILRNKPLSRYFMFLYQLLKIIKDRVNNNTYIEESAKFPLKKMYSNIVRASIPEKLMQLLLVNATWKDFTHYRELLEEFNFLEHVSFKETDNYLLLLIHCADEYNPTAFGKSNYFENLKKSNIFYKYVLENKILKYKELYESIFSKVDNNNSLQKALSDDPRHDEPSWKCTVSNNSNGIFNLHLKIEDFSPVRWSYKINGQPEQIVKCFLSVEDYELKIIGNLDKEKVLGITVDEFGVVHPEVVPKESYNN